MGEGTTPPAVPGAVVTALHDVLGGPDLTLAGSAAALTSSSVPSSNPYYSSPGVTTTLCLSFPTAGAYAQGDLISKDKTSFGFESWIKLPSTSGTQCIAYNGTPGLDGWGLYVIDGQLASRLGPSPVLPPSPFANSITHDTWTHVAIVRTSSFTVLYVNGQAQPNPSSAPVITPTGHFTLGATPLTTGPADFFTGSFDEARSFQTGTQGFNPSTDFLPDSPHMQVRCESVVGPVIAKGSTYSFGSAGTGGGLLGFFIFRPEPPYLVYAPLMVRGVTVGGADAADFQVLSYSSQTLYISFRPTTPGPKSATVTILSNDPDDSPFTFAVTGTAIAAPNISIFPGEDATGLPKLANMGGVQTFADAEPGGAGSGEKIFTILNSGLADLIFYSVSIFGTNASDFTVTDSPALTRLAPGQSTTFTVKFTPSGPGTRCCLIAIDSNAANSYLFRIPLAAAAPSPDIQLTGPDGVDLKSAAIVAWGDNSSHQCEVPAGLGPVTAIAAGDAFTAALRTDGTVVVWGSDTNQQLEIPSLSGVVAISAGYSHLLALKNDGTVVEWGFDGGPGAGVPPGLDGVTAISADNSFSLALKNDGTVIAWGNPAFTSLPGGLTGITAISAGESQNLALKSDGTVVEWGDSANDATSVPADLSNVTAIGTGFSQMALKTDGSIVTWETGHAPGGSPFPASSSTIISISSRTSHQTAVHADGSIAIAADSDTDSVLKIPAGLRFTTAMTCGTGHVAALYDSLIDFGSLPAAPQTFTLRNSGTAPLHLTGASITGPGAARYTLDATGLTGILAPGETTTLGIAFNAQAASPASDSATLQILSDAANRPAFTVQLTGSAPPSTTAPYDAWKLLHFSTTATTGDSADDADPNHNGIPNLLEYALGGDPLGTGAVLPKYALDSNSHATLTFPRITTASDITLTLQGSDTLDGSRWTDLARSTFAGSFTSLFAGITETDVYTGKNIYVTLTDASIVPAPTRRFLRLKATRN
jgi:hypothetical protein